MSATLSRIIFHLIMMIKTVSVMSVQIIARAMKPFDPTLTGAGGLISLPLVLISICCDLKNADKVLFT